MEGQIPGSVDHGRCLRDRDAAFLLWDTATAHGPMSRVKSAYLQRLSDQFIEDYEHVHGQLADGGHSEKRRYESLRHVREFDRMTEAYPIWPFDLGSLRLFLTAASSSLP